MSTAPTDAQAFRDRTPWLMAFGVVQCLFGLLMLLMGGLVLVAAALGGTPGTAGLPPAFLYGYAAAYALLGLLAGWLGVGSMGCRRWARNVTLVLAWMALLVGILALPLSALLLPQVLRQLGEQVQGVLGFVMAITLATLLILFVAVPGAFILVFGSRDARATCEWKDPTPSWTERVPLRVLGLVLACGYASVTYVTFGLMTPVPLFGLVLQGLAALPMTLAFSALFGAAAWGAYRLRPWAWWLVLGLVACLFLSSALTWLTGGFRRMYEGMGMAAADVEMSLALVSHPAVLIAMLAVLAGIVGYLVHLRRFFFPPPA